MPDDVKCTLILFTRVPIAGKVKTRLSAILSPEECALLQEAMVLDVAERLASLGNPMILSYSDEWRDEPDGQKLRDEFVAQVQEVCGQAQSFAAMPQEGADLGERMANAIAAAFEAGAQACLLMGSDLPDIMRNDVELAERALTYSDVVLGPSEDGGYWLIGVREPFAQIFEGKSYSSDNVLTEAVATCREHGRTVALSRETFDLDDPNDYYQLCAQVNKGDFRLGPRTVEAVRRLMPVTTMPSDE